MKKYVIVLSVSFFGIPIGQSHALSSETLEKLYVARECLPVVSAGAVGGAIGCALVANSSKVPLVIGVGATLCSSGGLLYVLKDRSRSYRKEIIELVARESVRFVAIGFVAGACTGGLTKSSLVGALTGAAIPGYMLYKALQ